MRAAGLGGHVNDESVVAAKVGDFAHASLQQVHMQVRLIFAEANFFRPDSNSNRHPQGATDAVTHTDHTDCGADFAPVCFIQRQPAFQQIHVADEPGHKPAVGMLVNFLRRAHLQHPALAHDRDARRHRHGFFLVVRHHHTGHAN